MGDINENVMIDNRAITTSIPTKTATSPSTTSSTTVTPTESTSAATTISPRTTTSSTTVTPTESTSAATTISPSTTRTTTVRPSTTKATAMPTGSTVTPTESTVAPTGSTVTPTESTVAPMGSTVTPTESTVAPTGTSPTPRVTVTETPTGTTPTQMPTGTTPTQMPTGTTPTEMPTGTTPTQMPTGTTPTMTATVSETPTISATVSETPTHTPTESPTVTVTLTPTDTPTESPSVTVTLTPTDTPTDTPTHTPTDTPTETPTVTPEARVTWVVYYPSGTVKTYSNESNDSFAVYGADTYDTVMCENCFYDITNGNYMVYRGYNSSLSEPRVITLCYKSTTAGPTETPTATETPTDSSTSTVTPDPSIPPVTDSPTTFKVNSKPTIIKYTGKQSISIKLGSIYSAASAYVVPRYYHKSNKFGVFTDNNTSTSDDFRYFNVMKTADSNTAYSYNISLKTSPNLYPASNDETIAGTSNEIPSVHKYNYEKWTYTWNSVRINPRLINNGANGEIICNAIDSPVFEVRQKQNNITLPESHSISFYGNTTLKDYQVGPVVIEPINSYSNTVIAKITKVSSNNILSFSDGSSSISVKRGEQISVKRNTTSSSGWAYITITSGDTVLTPPFPNPISYTCVVKLNYLGSKPGSSGSSGNNNSGNNNGNNNNDVVNPYPSGSDTTTPTPTQSPSDSPTPSSSDTGSGTWLSVEGIIYDMTDDGAIHYLTGTGDIACGGSVRYAKVQSEVTTQMWYVHVYSKNSNSHLYTIIIGYRGAI